MYERHYKSRKATLAEVRGAAIKSDNLREGTARPRMQPRCAAPTPPKRRSRRCRPTPIPDLGPRNAELRHINIIEKRFGAFRRPFLGVVQRSIDIVLPILPR